MDIAWLQYKRGTKIDYHLVLSIVVDDDKLSALLCEQVSDLDIERIRKHSRQLSEMKPEERLEWFRNNVSNFAGAFKEFKKDRYKIEKVFGVTSI